MLYHWKSGKLKQVYDSASGAVLALNSLEYKMIQAIVPPPAPLCPSSLRYELAKYDAADVEEAYDRIYAWYRDGVLFAQASDDILRLRVGGEDGITDADETLQQILSCTGGVMPIPIVCATADPKLAREICDRLGLHK